MKKKQKTGAITLFVIIGLLSIVAVLIVFLTREQSTSNTINQNSDIEIGEKNDDSEAVIQEINDSSENTGVETNESSESTNAETNEDFENAIAEEKGESKVVGDQEINEGSETIIKDKVIDFDALGIHKYNYPTEFSIGDNLKAAIIQLALCYEKFDMGIIYSENWKETFVAKFIQNSRLSFEYLDIISDKNKGEISIAELNYIQYSLTNIEIDFSSYVNGSINRYDASSGMSYGMISDYEFELIEDGVIITADFMVGTDGTDLKQSSKLTVNLVKNPYSCFDGYSIVSITSEAVNASIGQEGSEYVFCGTDMMEEENGVFTFEFLYSEDDLNYGHFVSVDLTQLPELADMVRNNAGSDFKVTFTLSEGQLNRIETVVPTDVILNE